MTLVNVETGELIGEPEVRASIRRVIDHAESIWDEWAWQVENKTWGVLGYETWDEMRRAEYGALTSVAAPRAERPELVARFRNAGLTQKQTADTLGIGQASVSRHDPTDNSGTGRPRDIQTDNPEPEDVVDAEIVEDDEPKPESTKRETRRPLPDQFFDAAFDLTKAVERIARLSDDDRFPQNAEKVARHRNDLLGAIDGIQSVINRLPSA